MPRLERLALALLLLAAACSKKPAQNYRNCLKLRIGMTREQMIRVMGEPEETIPYVEGKSLPHLKGHTAYEWRTPSAMAAPNHVSFDDASGTVETIRCGDSTVNTALFVEPPAESTAAPAALPAAAPAPAPPSGSLLPGSVVVTVGTGAAARRATVAFGTGKFQFQSGWMQADGGRMMRIDGTAAPSPDGSTELEYEMEYAIKPPTGKMTVVRAQGTVKVPAQGEVELKAAPDGPVTLSAAKELP